jgi:hypothetical protein
MVAIESFAAKALSVMVLLWVNRQVCCLAVFNCVFGISGDQMSAPPGSAEPAMPMN